MEVIAFVIKNDKGETLFVRRSPAKKVMPNIWSFPCEVIEEDETLFKTALRGGREDLGVEIELLDMFDELDHFSEDEKKQVRIMFFNTKIVDGEINVDPDDISEMVWEDYERFLLSKNDSELAHGLRYLKSKITNQKV